MEEFIFVKRVNILNGEKSETILNKKFIVAVHERQQSKATIELQVNGHTDVVYSDQSVAEIWEQLKPKGEMQ